MDFNLAEETEVVQPEATEAVEAPKNTGGRPRITPANPFSMAPVKQQLAAYSGIIDEMVKKAEAHQITDEPTHRLGVTYAGQAKRLFNEVEKKRKTIVENPNKFVKAVNALCKGFTERLKEIENGQKRKADQYSYKVEMERRDREHKAQEEARKLQAALDAEAKEKNLEPVIVPEPVMPTAPTVTRTEDGAASHTRTEWTYEVEDEAQIPREYLLVDEKKIRQAVKMGIREIAGVKIFEQIKTVIRT